MRLRPTTLFYASWEAKASEEGTAGEAWAALLPCFTMYEAAGRFIAKRIREENPYREWLSAYGDPAYSKTVESAVALANPRWMTMRKSAITAMMVTAVAS